MEGIKKKEFDRWDELENDFKKEAEKEKSVYIPNFPLIKKPDFVFVAMEPSLGWWTKGKNDDERKRDAEEKVKKGFKNFFWSPSNFTFRLCLEKYLGPQNFTYHLTDISKGAMKGDIADKDRDNRCEKWFPLLLREIDIISHKGTLIIPFGGYVEKFLKKKKELSDKKLRGKIFHYCYRFSKGLDRFIEEGNLDEEYKLFLEEINETDCNELIRKIVDARKSEIPDFQKDNTEKKIPINFTSQRKKLMFSYKVQFEELKKSFDSSCCL